MTLARASLVARSDLRTRIRREVLDPALTSGGISISPAARRFSDAEIDEALADGIIELTNQLNLNDPPTSVLLETIEYSEDETAKGHILPATIGLASAPIYKVEEQQSGGVLAMDPVSPQEIDRYDWGTSNSMGYLAAYRARRYAIRSGVDPSVSDAVLVVRPKPPGGLTLRVWYLGGAVLPGSDTDQHALTDRWAELLVLAATERLLGRDDSFTNQQRDRYGRLLAMFAQSARRRAQTQYVRRARTWRT